MLLIPTAPKVRFVLVRPRVPENLGAAARALANFGFDDWALVRLGTHDFASARRVAVHAEGLLDRPRVVASLEDAVADCTLLVGTTARSVRGRRALDPAEVGRLALSESARGRLALLFGGERDGLSADELRRCDELSSVSTASAQPSLNLAQAVALYAHAIRQAVAGGEPTAPEGPGASDDQLRRVEEGLRRALRAGGFLVGPERHAVRDLVATLRRARLSRREASLWVSALSRLGRAAGEGRQPTNIERAKTAKT